MKPTQSYNQFCIGTLLITLEGHDSDHQVYILTTNFIACIITFDVATIISFMLMSCYSHYTYVATVFHNMTSLHLFVVKTFVQVKYFWLR